MRKQAYLDSIFLVCYEVDACLHSGISTFSQYLFLQSVDIWSLKWDILGRYSDSVSLKEISVTCHKIILVTKGFTLKTARETVRCPAALFLLVSLFGIWDVNGLARRHICKPRGVLLRTSKILPIQKSCNRLNTVLLTVSWRGIKTKRWINKMGSVFSEVIRLKGILALRNSNMSVWLIEVVEWWTTIQKTILTSAQSLQLVI